MKITIKSNSSELSIECDDSVKVSINIGDAKGRCWKYEVVGEVPREEQQDNILSKTAVDTRWSNSNVTKKSRGSVEERFAALSDAERVDLAGVLDVPDYWSLASYLQEFTYREIRQALDVIER